MLFMLKYKGMECNVDFFYFFNIFAPQTRGTRLSEMTVTLLSFWQLPVLAFIFTPSFNLSYLSQFLRYWLEI